MKIKFPVITVLLALMMVSAPDAKAQRNAYKGAIEFSEPRVNRTDGILRVNIRADLNNLQLGGQQMVTLTPMLRLNEGGSPLVYRFSPIIIAGNTRYKALARAIRLDNADFPEAPSEIIRRRQRDRQYADIELSVPFEEWMRRAELVFAEAVSGCAQCDIAYAEYIMEGLLPPALVPVYSLIVEAPQVEPVKTRSETHTAAMNFVVGKYQLLPDYKNNAEVLAEADRIVSEVMSDPDLTFTTLRVDGYASPEGDYNFNMKLSENRAMAFVKYLQQKHGIPESRIAHYGHGEDWEGLRKTVAGSDLAAREEVLEILDGTSGIPQRKARLHALNGGATYRFMLANYYPPLRRNEYTFTYVARPFSVEEARETIKTRPDLLSLNEMYLVAGSYPAGSSQYRETLRKAVEYFPTESVAAANLAAAEIEAGNPQIAVDLLARFDTPAAYNNLGVAYATQGAVDRAEEYFRRAAEAGSEEAVRNLDQLLQWRADQ